MVQVGTAIVRYAKNQLIQHTCEEKKIVQCFLDIVIV